MGGWLQESYADLEGKVALRTRELAQSVEELRALGEVSQAVNSTLDLPAVLSTIVAKAVQLSDTEAGAIYVYDDLQQQFRLRATHGMSDALIEAIAHRQPEIGDTTIGEAAQRREPIQIANLSEEPPSPIVDIILAAGFRALLVVPLLRPDRVLGALVIRRCQPGEFPKATVDLLQTFAAQSVLAIQNARLFTEIEEQSRELEVASQHKSQFLANMSHELRTPLNAIIGYSEMLQEEAEDLGADAFLPDLQKINAAGKHLLGLINDILDLSKIEAGKMDLYLETFDVGHLVGDVAAIVQPLIEKNGNVLTVDCSPDLGDM